MSIFKRLFGKKSSDEREQQHRTEKSVTLSKENDRKDYNFRWHDPGPENPFGLRLLDCRPLTQTVVATTSERAIAERYNLLRGNDGRDLVGASITDGVHCATSLKFPHNGAPLEGIVFKANSMDV